MTTGNRRSRDTEPWKEVLVAIWLFLTEGKRKYATIPLFVIFVAVGVVSTFQSNLKSLCPILFQTIVLEEDEPDAYDGNEWVLQIRASGSKEELKKQRSELQKFCTDLGFLAEDKEPLGSKQFLIIRNPHEGQSFLLVIDIYGEEISTEELYKKALAEILQYSETSGISKDLIHDWFGHAKVLRCSKFWLQFHHGRIKG